MSKKETKNEFFTLIPRAKVDGDNQKSKKKKDSQSEKPKFKKGSWKHYLWKKIKKWKSSKFVEDFHFVKFDNLAVYTKDGKPKIVMSSSRFDLKKLKDLQKKHGDLYVFVNATERMYMKISLKSYLKLMEIDKIAINFRLEACFDGEVEIDELYESDTIIDNINELANYINYHRKGIEGVYEIQARCCAYTDYHFKCRILVYKRDGSVETYKSDMNDFMKAYDLYQF